MAKQLTEHNYKCNDEQRGEIHKALAKEYEALSQRANEKKIKLFNGIFQQELAGKYIYLFSLPKEHDKQIEVDKPYIFSIDNSTIKGSIITILINKLEIEIELYENKGRLIPALEIIIDLKVLIDLIDRRIVAIDKDPNKFKTETATFLFNPKPKTLDPYFENKVDHLKRKDGIKLTTEQIEAINACLKQKLTLIWGPPGTGKTKTLQGVIAELLLLGNKVLFASNTNNAIDGLLKDLTGDKYPYEVFNELKKEGKIVRIGSQTNEEVKNVFGSFEVAKYKSEEIQSKIIELQEIIEVEEKSLKELQDELKEYEDAKKLKKELDNLDEKIKAIKASKDVQNEINVITECRDNLNLSIKESEKVNDIIKKFDILFEKIENQKKRGIGINAMFHKTKSEKEIKEQESRNIRLKIDKLEKAFLGRYRNKKEIENLIENQRSNIAKIDEMVSDLRSYEVQQAKELTVEAELIGEFVDSLSKIKTITASINFKRDVFKNHLLLLGHEYRIENILPQWTKLGIEYKIISEEQAKDMSYFATLSNMNFDSIPILYEEIIYKLNRQIEVNKKNRINLETDLKKKEKEFLNYKHLLLKTERFWKQIDDKIKLIQKTIEPIQLQINDLTDKIRNIEKDVIKEAMLVCCTMVKSSYDETLGEIEFDSLVVDETSMVLLPQLYCTATLIKERVILCGDHLQLQPISTSNSKIALKWLASSYYDFIELNGEISIEKNDEDSDTKAKVKRITKLLKLNSFQKILTIQHRMPPDIADLIRPWYGKAGNKLKDEYEIPRDFQLSNYYEHFIFSNSNIFFFDTSSIGTYHSRTSDRSPYNIINAAIVAEITRELIENYKIEPQNIRCLSPYRAQYQLTSALLSKFLPNEYKSKISNIASSVHKIQGGEAPIVFYDLTDGSQGGFTGFIKTVDLHIHNVAISRSQYKLIFVGDLEKLNRLREKVPKSSLNDILPRLSKAKIIDVKALKEKIFKQFSERDLINENAILLTEEQRNNILILTSSFYFRLLEDDIAYANNSVLIISPFVTKPRWNKLKESLLNFKSRTNGAITIITRPPEKMYSGNQVNMAVVAVLNEFIHHGFIVKVSPKIHSKLVVIDRGTDNAIAYWGSLNPLSFNDTDEVNTRIVDQHIAEQLINMSMVGNIYPYKENALDETALPNHTADSVMKQLNEFRWTLAGYYHRPMGAICSNDTIEKIIEYLPNDTRAYKQIPQYNRKNFVLWNHTKEIEEIISPLREFQENTKVCDEVKISNDNLENKGLSKYRLKEKIEIEKTELFSFEPENSKKEDNKNFNYKKAAIVEVGDLVELKGKDTGTKKYRITMQNVGFGRFTQSGLMLVNHRAPIAKSILNKSVGDICKLENADVFFEIISIRKNKD